MTKNVDVYTEPYLQFYSEISVPVESDSRRASPTVVKGISICTGSESNLADFIYIQMRMQGSHFYYERGVGPAPQEFSGEIGAEFRCTQLSEKVPSDEIDKLAKRVLSAPDLCLSWVDETGRLKEAGEFWARCNEDFGRSLSESITRD